ARDAPRDRVVVRNPHDEAALALHQHVNAPAASSSPEGRIEALVPVGHASSRLSTIDAFVPPKPNEFDSTQDSATLSRRSRTIGMSSNAGSSFSMLALSQMKPLFIISSE